MLGDNCKYCMIVRIPFQLSYRVMIYVEAVRDAARESPFDANDA